jgi:hypothetical protein
VSYAIKMGKVGGYQGDPGLFSFIGKAIGSVAGLAGKVLNPISTIANIGSVLTPSKPQVLVHSSPSPGTRMTSGSMPTLLSRPGVGSGISIGGPQGLQVGTFPAPGVATTYPSSSGPLVGSQQAAACTVRGYHHNKSTYYTKKYGVIQKGTVCVKNRRRNPLNPRALSRALARLESAKKATSCLARYSVRPKKSCGCGR